MNYRQARNYLITHLHTIYTESECENMLGRFIEAYTTHRILDFKLDQGLTMDEDRLIAFAKELSTSKPVQYILGFEWFGDIQVKVNEHVLIPRPETVELVLWIKEVIQNRTDSLRLIDIGTGSGCIPIWLKRHLPLLDCTAIDVSANALELAKANAQQHDTGIQFLQIDILKDNLECEMPFDIIVSNPPYITYDEMNEMASNVLDYEPHVALFVDNGDALQFYKAIKLFADKHLADDGQLFFEVGSMHAKTVESYFHDQGFHTELRKDMFGLERMLKAWK